MKYRYDEFSNWVTIQGELLKKRLLYKQPFLVVVFLLVILFPSVKNNVSLLFKLVGCFVFLMFYLPLIVYPLIRKAKLIGHIINRVEIKDNYCYLYYKNIFNADESYDVYELNDISIAEREVFQEQFFRTEKFVVLNAKQEKFYLVGQLLIQYESAFSEVKGSKSL